MNARSRRGRSRSTPRRRPLQPPSARSAAARGASGSRTRSAKRRGAKPTGPPGSARRDSRRRRALSGAAARGRRAEATGRGSPRPAAGARGVEAILAAQPWEELIPHLLKLAADPAETLPVLRRYVEQLLLWNRSVSNLMSRHDEIRVVDRHLRESIEPGVLLKESRASRWIDFGSGAGFPALPLAIAGVGQRWTLVEPRRPKGLFIDKVILDNKLEGITVVRARLESLVGVDTHAAAYDGFTSRATMPLGPTLGLAASFLAPGGVAFLWKGSRREEEMARDHGWRRTWEMEAILGIGDGRTTVSKFRKI